MAKDQKKEALMPSVQSNGINLSYEIHGEGEPLVLIAGIGYPLWVWHRMIPRLEGKVQVIAFDNRGVGQSSKPQGSYSAQLMAEDTVGLLDALDLSKATILGHSMGGFIAQAMALEHPERVERLILCSTNFGGPHHVPVTPEAMAVLSDVSGDPIERFRRGIEVSVAPGWAKSHPEIIREWVDFRLRNPIDPIPYQAQLAVGLSLIAEDASFEHKLKNIKSPTLILFGEHDKVVPPANAQLLAAQIPGSSIHILPDAGHFFPIETPDAAADAILQFMQP
jgi:pimeloyl-ACP methyl ester carboxylesterase